MRSYLRDAFELHFWKNICCNSECEHDNTEKIVGHQEVIYFQKIVKNLQ